jgi:cytochrome b pre-mRNA-processing protein 3
MGGESEAIPLLQSLFRQRRSKTVAARLYATAVAQARRPAFYTDFAAPDTMEGRFELYSLHVILLVRRLRDGGPEADETAQALVDTFTSGLDHGLREAGVGDLAVPRRMRKLSAAFLGRAEALDAALGPSPETLEPLLGRTVFDGGQGRAPELAGYVRDCAAALAAQPLAALLDGDAAWPDSTP